MYSIKYNEKEIEYSITRSKIKNVYIHIKDGNVIVKAPMKLKVETIQRIVAEKSDWIYKKLDVRNKQNEENKEIVKLLGKKYPLKIITTNNTAIYIENGIMIIEIPEKDIHKKDEIIKNILDNMYYKVAEKEVDIAMQIITRIVGIKPNKYRIKKLKTAWGTCTSNKNISINPELMKYDREVIQYVVLHEVCHLKYMNHSTEFWNMVGRYMENYKDVRKRLKQKDI